MTKHDSKTADELIVLNEQLNSCCKDWIEVNEYQQAELVELRKKNSELEKMLIKLADDDCNEWYRLEILNLLNGVDNL